MMTGTMTEGCFPSKMDSGPGPLSQPEEDPGSQELPPSTSSTQPLESPPLLPDSQETEEEAWGQLYPHCGSLPRIPLKTESFKIGRLVGDFIIKSSELGDTRWFNTISTTQCEIFKNEDGVFLMDYSSNGTWVNGHKVGKNFMWPLENNAEIAFAGAHKKVFVFISNEETEETFPAELTSSYTVSKVLGTGASAEVRLAFRIPDMHRVALKIIKKKNNNALRSGSQSGVLNEVKLLQSFNHPNIIRLEEVIDSSEFLVLVLELAEGGELFDQMIKETVLEEDTAKFYFQQMVTAVAYLHSREICHRDLKPENVLLSSSEDPNPVLKLTDLGLSKLVDKTILKTFCGTKIYMAPEMWKKSEAGRAQLEVYSLKVDCWALGVLLYEMLAGTSPFTEERRKGLELKEQIGTADYVFPSVLFDQISEEARDLIQRLLVVNPEQRLSSEQILRHPWLQDPTMMRRIRELSSVPGRKRKVQEEVSVSATTSKKIRLEVQI